MCSPQFLVRQLVRLTELRCYISLDYQMRALFLTVFKQRAKAEWKEPEKRQIADLLRLNDLSLREGYRFRLACSQKFVINNLVMRSAAEFLINDFPDETQHLKESVIWGDDLTLHRCYSIHDGVDEYNELWEEPKMQPNVDHLYLPRDHNEWWMLYEHVNERPAEFLEEYYDYHTLVGYHPVDVLMSP